MIVLILTGFVKGKFASGMAHFCERKFFAAKPCFLAAVVVILYGNISDIVQILYALVAQPVEHLTFNQRARDSSSLERTKENPRLTVENAV